MLLSGEPGFDEVGDCVWPWHPSDIAMKKKLAQEVVQNFKNIEIRSVTVTGVPRRKGRRAQPYEPIEYAALWQNTGPLMTSKFRL